VTQTGWYQPYGVSRTRPNWYRNAEAGPSTLVAPPVPYARLPTTRPPGGIPETTADAKQTYATTEEDRATVSHFYCSDIPRVIEWSFGVRNPSVAGFPTAKEKHAPPVSRTIGLTTGCVTGYGTGGACMLPQHSTRLWRVSKCPVSNDASDQIGYNVVAAEIVRRKRKPFHENPILKRGRSERTVIGSKRADKAFGRRKVERRLYRRLSRYYSTPIGGPLEWACPPLLVEGEYSMITHRTNNIPLTQTLSVERS